VCRRILGNSHDAEDAFQATFLVLVRKAASIRPAGMVGNWLYGVAHRKALEARRSAAKRRAASFSSTEACWRPGYAPLRARNRGSAIRVRNVPDTFSAPAMY
jgi:DNA-directed RNA polymerase specialized sigma24 family protein